MDLCKLRPRYRFTNLPVHAPDTAPKKILEAEPSRRALGLQNTGTGDVDIAIATVWTIKANTFFSPDNGGWTHNGPLFAWGAVGHDLLIIELVNLADPRDLDV